MVANVYTLSAWNNMYPAEDKTNPGYFARVAGEGMFRFGRSRTLAIRQVERQRFSEYQHTGRI